MLKVLQESAWRKNRSYIGFHRIVFLPGIVPVTDCRMVTSAATAPALIVVGILMMESLAKIKWDEFEEAVSAFFTVVVMPFTYSISNGVAAGFVFYVITKIVKAKQKRYIQSFM